MKTVFSVNVLAIAVLFFTSSCNKEGNPVSTGTPATPDNGGNISTGQTVDLGNQVIGTSGGSFTISRPGDPLNGLQLTVPAKGFDQPKTFSISYAAITSHRLGNNINPVSPLIKITYDGGYSAQEMKLKVPIKLPQGSFAMAFFYDESTGALEPVPLLSLDSTSITVSTRSLSLSNTTLAKSLAKRTQSVYGELFVSSILQTVLQGHSIISTGFTPGADDWEFPNYGSYISPGGHCAGQSVTAMWYYYEQRLKGRPYLFHLYDKITDPNKPDSLWCDNPLGYRFASTIQEDLNFDTWVRDMGYKSWVPNIVFNSFAYAMLVTGEPQLVTIMNSLDTSGHAMVVYSIDPITYKLYVADPNYPNNRDPASGTPTMRFIQYIPGLLTGQFQPYSSAAKAGDKGESFDIIGYSAKTSLIEWGQISKRWVEFLNGTIGNDRFPSYSLVNHQTGFAFVDGLDTDRDTIKLHMRSTQPPFCLAGTAGFQPIDGYNELGKYLNSQDRSGVLSLWLKPGDNKFGLCLKSFAADTHTHFVDFKWVNIHRHLDLSLASTAPNQAPFATAGAKNKVYTFITKSAQPVPQDGKVKYVWSFSDGPSTVTVNNDSVTNHTFLQEGTFTVGVSFYYDLTLITQASAQATISPTPPPLILRIEPSIAMIGDTVKIKGKYFGADKTKGSVTFATSVVASQIASWIDTVITVKVPQGAQTGSVIVTVGGLASNGVTFTVSTVPVPTITGLMPSVGRMMDTIAVNGNNFGSDKTKGYVTFSSASSMGTSVMGTATIAWSNTKIMVIVPADAITGPLTVTVNNVKSNGVLFTVDATPWIDVVYNSGLVTPSGTPKHSWGLPGRVIEIQGRNFGDSFNPGQVLFNNVAAQPAQYYGWSSTYGSATIPSGMGGAVSVTVKTKGGLISNARTFFVGVPMDTIRLHPNVHLNIGLSVNYFDKKMNSTQSTSLGLSTSDGNVIWAADGFTANVRDFSSTKSGTLKVTLSPDCTEMTSLDLNYTNLAPFYESVHYSAAGHMAFSITSTPNGDQGHLQFAIEGNDAIIRVTQQVSGTVTPVQDAYTITGMSSTYYVPGEILIRVNNFDVW